MYDEITYDVDNGIATVMIDRPDVHNAFTERTIEELNDALEQFHENETAYVAVLTGADNGFCAGADVNTMPDWAEQSKEDYASFLDGVQDVVRNLRESAKPTVAAVGGPAIGAGCDMALACDLRVVGSDAVLREGFVKIGLVPGDGGAWLLPRLIGEAKAREYLLTGRDISPEAAVEMGLAVEIADNALIAARDIAAEIKDMPAQAVRLTNRLLNGDESFEDHAQRAIEYQWDCITDPEHKEAVAAFREKREPEFDRDFS
ncbi:enoyl-CoA hydratase/isomerase family protein [Haladaptatus sp. DFWS20]|uniref:enoyl-CoA hydratase/isomerase family protein n=1 Tax=Haladaptatus sp. DFWS20 TaxID=3403467 RepID=UPI003EC0E207